MRDRLPPQAALFTDNHQLAQERDERAPESQLEEQDRKAVSHTGRAGREVHNPGGSQNNGDTDRGAQRAVNLRPVDPVRAVCPRAGSVMASPQLEELRERQVRTVVLVDDNIASGSTITGYLDKWWENPSIRSWRSYKLVRFVIVTYACSPLGMRTVSRHRLADDIRSVEFGGDFSSAHWTPAERNEVRDVCRRYASRYAIKKSLELGYKQSESLLIVGHTLPNNLPNILWAGEPVVQPWSASSPKGIGA
jgi:hypothetical protein